MACKTIKSNCSLLKLYTKTSNVLKKLKSHKLCSQRHFFPLSLLRRFIFCFFYSFFGKEFYTFPLTNIRLNLEGNLQFTLVQCYYTSCNVNLDTSLVLMFLFITKERIICTFFTQQSFVKLHRETWFNTRDHLT